ncbi:TetR/AcrR family transcriptional regulator [Streptomyces sp. 184]|uniref:TetR/AcrR family transcriptional regulator n=1 Tax=Streptomyces sp. 184 TaxID=1827526 RepID=UPI003892506A
MTETRSGRRPDPAVDTAIREAVIELLFERGFEMTFDEVAARAGVGRATVFRRFPTKRDLVLDAVAQLTVSRIQMPDTGSLRGDLLAGIAEIMRVFGEPRLRLFTRRILGEACRDAAFSDVLRANLDRRLELISGVLDRGVLRGELPASADPALISDLLSGLLAVRLATDTALPGPEEIAALVDGLLHGFAAQR